MEALAGIAGLLFIAQLLLGAWILGGAAGLCGALIVLFMLGMAFYLENTP